MKRYGAIDGLRAYAAIGIVMMHVMENGGYEIAGFIGKSMIPSFTDFVYLFMAISAFGLCCGYISRFENGSIDLESFYKKRFLKVLPFFSLLSVVDVVFSPSKEAVMELFANITLLFGFLPNANISVIGVGWFLGVVFVFYILFPFFTIMLKSKKRAWFGFAVAVAYNILCTVYFMDTNHVIVGFSLRHNIVYCFVFFMAGGLIYLYRKKLEKINIWIATIVTLLSVVTYYLIGGNTFTCLFVSSSLLITAVRNSDSGKDSWGGILKNRFTIFVGGLSMEVYLCHMLFFRILERMNLTRICGNEIVSYAITVVTVLIMSIVFSFVVKMFFEVSLKRLNRRVA